MGAEAYIIRGGVPGRERLRMVSEIMRPSTATLLSRVGPAPGDRVLDLGCGGGDVTLELARRVRPKGSVVGLDFDPVAVAMAGEESRAAGLANARFVAGDLLAEGALAAAGAPFDVVYARFLLSHLADPDAALALIHAAIRPGGRLVVEDVDFAGHFCHPPSAAFDRYVALYQAAARRRKADANIGPSLPARLAAAGFEDTGVAVAQPASRTGPEKLIAALTMENIAEAVQSSGLASAKELSDLVAELYRIGADGETVMAIPRIVQAWGRKPAQA
jgi:SAM-dependent methyltransferase